MQIVASTWNTHLNLGKWRLHDNKKRTAKMQKTKKKTQPNLQRVFAPQNYWIYFRCRVVASAFEFSSNAVFVSAIRMESSKNARANFFQHRHRGSCTTHVAPSLLHHTRVHTVCHCQKYAIQWMWRSTYFAPFHIWRQTQSNIFASKIYWIKMTARKKKNGAADALESSECSVAVAIRSSRMRYKWRKIDECERRGTE